MWTWYKELKGWWNELRHSRCLARPVHERPRSPMFVPTMSNLAAVVIGVVDGCALCSVQPFLRIMPSCAHPPKGGLNANAIIYGQ